jgi:hypothetical protein
LRGCLTNPAKRVGIGHLARVVEIDEVAVHLLCLIESSVHTVQFSCDQVRQRQLGIDRERGVARCLCCFVVASIERRPCQLGLQQR